MLKGHSHQRVTLIVITRLRRIAYNDRMLPGDLKAANEAKNSPAGRISRLAEFLNK